MEQVVLWIRDKKRFAYVGVDYIVVGMSRAEYDKLFAKKQKDFNYEMFADELAEMSDEDFEKIAKNFPKLKP